VNSIFFPAEDVQRIREGQVVFNGALLLADVSGFTALTELLSKSGKNGTEQLTSVLNSFFDKMLTIAAKLGGVVITFSGDSLLVRFNTQKNALNCAAEMLEAMNHFTDISVLNNNLSLRAKVVVGAGAWNQYIVGDNERAHLLVYGDLVRELAACEEQASAGDLIHFTMNSVSGTTPVRIPAVNENAFLSPGTERLFGEHRPVTAVFLNVFSESIDSTVVEEFQKLYLIISESVRKYGGYLHHVEATLSGGFRILLLFGAPVSMGNDTINSVYAVSEIYSLKQEIPVFSISCGIDNGYVFSGMVGNEQRKQYTVIGDPVNTAARLSDKTVSGTVNVSESVYNRTLSQFVYTELSGIAVKGKERRLRRFKLSGRTEFRNNPIPFVGRKIHLEEVGRLIRSSGKTVLLSGSMGIGKTTFLAKLNQILSEDGFTVVSAEKTVRGSAHEIMASIAGSICGIKPEMSETAKAGLLHRHLMKSGNTDLQAREVFLARMLFDVDFPHETFELIPPKLRRENLLDAVIDLVCELPEPACIIVEDVHYSAEDELNTLNEIAKTVRRRNKKRISFLLSCRPGKKDLFADDDTVTKYTLKGLSGLYSQELLASLAENVSIEESILESISARSEGNPFYLVQFMLYLKEKELIAVKNHKWEKVDETSLSNLPESIFSMIMARIDTLMEKTRESLKVASVVGMNFSEYTVETIVGRSVHYDFLETSGAKLSRSAVFPDLEHVFNHSLIRDVTYDSMLRKRRKQVHLETGILLEKNTTGGTAARTRLLAHHFVNAENWEKGLFYSLNAGILASEEYRNTEAMEYFTTVINILEKHFPERKQELADCLYKYGSVCELTGDYSRAVNYYERALDCNPDILLSGKIILSLAEIHYNRGELEKGLELVGDIEHRLKDLNVENKILQLKISAYRSWCHCISGKMDSAKIQALKAVEIGDSLSPEDGSSSARVRELGHALNTLATVHWAKSEYPRARELYERAVRIALDNGLKREAAITYGNIGLVLEKQGRFKQAVEYMKKQLNVSREIGEKLITTAAHGELGMVYASLGNFEQALYHFNRQKQISELLEAPMDRVISYNHLAALHRTLGKFVQAERYLEQAISLSRQFSIYRELGRATFISAQLKKDTQEYEASIDLLSQAEAMAENNHVTSLLQIIYIEKADVFLSLDKLDDSLKMLKKARAAGEKTQMQTGIAGQLCVLGKYLFLRGEYDEAKLKFKQSMRIYAELDAKPYLAQAYQTYAGFLSGINEMNDLEAETYLRKAADLYRKLKLTDKVKECEQNEKAGT